MTQRWSIPSVLVAASCLGILMAGYMPDELPLRFVESHTNYRVQSREDLASVSSPSGSEVYFSLPDELVVYRRDRESGQLTEIQHIPKGYDKMSRPSTLAVHPTTGNFLLPGMGSLMHDAVREFQPQTDSGILKEYVMKRPGTGGLLSYLDGFACPSDGKHLYMVSTTEQVLIVLAHRGGASFELVQCFQDDAVLGINVNGALVPSRIDGAEIIDGLEWPQTIIISPDDRFVYVGARSDGCLTVFERDPPTGRLRKIQQMTNNYRDEHGKRWSGQVGIDLDGVTEIAFDPNATHIYAICGSSVNVLSRDADSGIVAVGHYLSGFRAGIPTLEKAESIVVSKSGRYVFVAAHGDEFSHRGAVNIFKRDQVTGRLEFYKAIDRKEVAGARHLSLSPDGRHLFVSTWHQTLAVFAVIEDDAGAAADGRNAVTQND